MDDGGPENRRGRLLVASPALEDPNFHRAVVLMLEHSAEGALGLVLNDPTPLLARDALPGALAEAMPEDERIHRGGPVQPEAVIVLAEFDDPERAAAIAFGDVGVVDPDAETEGLDGDVRAVRAFGGYAGWSGGQLESEIAQEAWIDAEPEAGDVFTTEAEGLWSRVLDRKGGPWRILARMPEDPTTN
ncbi:MAG: YqgE/AlgH family protein [Thermoleophilia bacterium]